MQTPDNPPQQSGSTFLPIDLLWQAIVDSSDDAIVTKNLSGIIMSWNAGATRIFGYTAEEIVGKSILTILPPDRKDEERHILERLRRGERVDHFETIRVRKDGSLLNVSLTISPIKNSAGEVIGASKIARDITAQKKAMDQLAKANEQLRKANTLKAEFISTLSHELRTPLNAILGWTQILRSDPSPEDLSEGLTIIERNLRVQSQLIEELLDMSRIEAGKVLLDIQKLDLASVIAAAMDVVASAAAGKNIRLTTAISSVEGVVMGDKNRMQQIIWNLLHNAIKFTPKNGRIHVTLERINSHVEIAVADNGIGIAPEFFSHIFERFSQIDASTTRTHGGLGLGLSIVKNLVELHGGTVQAKSPGLNQGSTFIVSLPLVPVRNEPELAEPEQRQAGVDQNRNEDDLIDIKVLAVDDDEDSVGILSRILTRHGAIMRTSTSVEEALEIFSEFKPDVVLSDIGLPNRDGYDFIRHLRALPFGRHVPAVALMALARSEDRTNALRAGFQMHVAKPVDANELVAVVRNLAELRVR
ncbi:MAG TPA: ATP-binding protein [Chthoniobacteraceae bacterium]|nr:ATP-binding protein [Chthoniobacteraceae bacterium]